MGKLSKSEFMHKVINDLDKKRTEELEKQKSADRHIYENVAKVKQYKGRKRK